MPKMKTKSGAKKRFKTTRSGKVKAKASHMRHMQMNKPKSMKRKARRLMNLCAADARIVLRSFLPYGRKKKKVRAVSDETKQGGTK